MARLLVFDGFVCVCFISSIGYLLGLNKYLTIYGDNGCEMTYMYEYPQFVKVNLSSNVTAAYRRYDLYAYSEGRQTQQTRSMRFSGIPVLFIPGQGGSYKQVRSFASVSLRKALGSDCPFHFDYFTLDLNEEYSAMYGGVLRDQTRFTVYAVLRILLLYKPSVRPDSMVIIGHSMGGVIAKSLFLEEDFPSHAVRLVITLATPHSPVLLTDPLLRDYYQRVAPLGPKITLISLSGGTKDLVVRSGLALTDTANISALTTAVSGVWMSMDHLCILWCKQLVIVLVRALFDCVNRSTRQISRDPQFRLNVFKYHLLERSAGKSYLEASHPPQTSLQTTNADWVLFTKPRHRITRPSIQKPLHIVVQLPVSESVDMLLVTTLNHKGRDWLFGCSQLSSVSSGLKVCTIVENLSAAGRIAPTKLKKHKVAKISLTELRSKELHYVVIRLPPSDEPITISYDMFSTTERKLKVILPRPFQSTSVLPSTTPGIMFHTLDLSQLEWSWQVFRLALTLKSCTDKTIYNDKTPDPKTDSDLGRKVHKALKTHQAVITLRVPWSHQHSSVILRYNVEATLPIMLHTAKPADWSDMAPYVTLHLDPMCQYSIRIDSSVIESQAQLVRLYSSQLLAYMTAILLLTLSEQLHSLATRQHCLLFHHALFKGAKPYHILAIVKSFSIILSWPVMPNWLHVILPSPDLAVLTQSRLDSFLLPMILYCIAFGLTFTLGLITYAVIVFSGSTINKLALKLVSKLAGVSRTWSDWLMVVVDKVPFVVSVAMVALLMSSCGGLALLVGAVYYFMRVCGMYEDYIEQLFFAPLKAALAFVRGRQLTEIEDIIPEAEDLLSLKGLTEFNFHMTVMLLWAMATTVHIPSVLVWAHNFKYNPALDPDPATAVAVVASVCAAVLWTLKTPVCQDQHQGELYNQMSSGMFALACIVLLYCPISLYNLPVLVSIALVSLSAHQLYEWALPRRQQHNSQLSTVPTDSMESDGIDCDSTNMLLDNTTHLEESDEEQSEEESTEESEAESHKHSFTSEFSMSSYEALSLSELLNEAREEYKSTVKQHKDKEEGKSTVKQNENKEEDKSTPKSNEDKEYVISPEKQNEGKEEQTHGKTFESHVEEITSDSEENEDISEDNVTETTNNLKQTKAK